MKRAIAVTLVLSAAACGSRDSITSPSSSPQGAFTASAAPLQTEAPFRRILCFGDSLTAGVTLRLPQGEALLTPIEGYVPKLRDLLVREYGEDIEVIESGVPGETTSLGIRRLSDETLVYRPDLVLLLQGVVDVNSDDPRFVQTRSNLTEMVRIARGREASVIIGTIPPLNPEGFRANAPDNVRTLNEMIRGIAEREGVILADHERAFGSELSFQGPDGLHPNDSGYRVMAQTWFEAIKALAATRGAPGT